MTFFWNGNRSGYFNEDLETYVEVRTQLAVGHTAGRAVTCTHCNAPHMQSYASL